MSAEARAVHFAATPIDLHADTTKFLSRGYDLWKRHDPSWLVRGVGGHVDVPRMIADGRAARDGRPVLGLSRLDRSSIDELAAWVRSVLHSFRCGSHVTVDPGPMAPHWHAGEAGQGFRHAHEDGEHSHRHAGPAPSPS